MFAKRSSRALALLLALPSAAFALGLGDIRLLSPLNAPLDAEIELVDVAPEEMNSVQAQLASRETFARYGLDWPGYLSGVQVRSVRRPDGRTVIKLKSTDPISDPFITLLVEVNWSHGRLVREYTMLLDPPVYTPGQSAAASAPVSAPTTGTGTREGAIARSAENAAPAEAAPPSASAPATAVPATAAPTPASAAPASAASAAASAEGEGSTHVVHRGETLSRIAAAASGDSANTDRSRSWMLAIYQQNPRAFEQNMNLLRTGAVLRMPDAATVSAVSPREALAEIRRQTSAWRSSSAPAESAAAQPGRLKLVTPSETPSAGAAPGAASGEASALQGRVHDLESQLAESKRLLALKDADLARLQAQLAAKQGAESAAGAPAPPPEATAPAAAPPAPQPPAAAQPPAPVAQTPPPAPATQATSSKPTATRPASGGSIFKEYWWAVLIVLLALAGLLASRILRSRRASEFDDSLGRLAVAGTGGAGPDFGSAGRTRGFAADDTPARAAAPAAAAETTFLVEESGTHEQPHLGAGAAPAPAPRHVASDETISSDTAINLDQGDPLAEADFHMAYGLYDQAADLIRIAISREPGRRDLKLKLLEVFFVWGNKEQFLQTARELAESRAEAAPGEWEKILIMGKQLAPDDALFSGAGAVSGATAGGVDLDLEGGQSRIDFDLLGEPVAGEAAQGVDLDIGAAVGEHGATLEGTTNVTDRNAELLESSFLGSTGTTRQMTQRVQSDVGATQEMEGPTVEQPAMATPDNPTIRQKVETALRQSGTDQTAELALDDLGLDVGAVDTVDQPGPAAAATSTPDGPTLVAQTGEMTREMHPQGTSSTGAWQFDQTELEEALTQSRLAPDVSGTSRLAALRGQTLDVDVDVGDATGMHRAAPAGEVDLDVGPATGAHQGNGALDLDVGAASVPESEFGATQRLSAEELALPDLEPVTMSEVGTKLDLARAYMDMGDPDGARNILEEVLSEGSAAQKQEAQRLMEALPG